LSYSLLFADASSSSVSGRRISAKKHGEEKFPVPSDDVSPRFLCKEDERFRCWRCRNTEGSIPLERYGHWRRRSAIPPTPSPLDRFGRIVRAGETWAMMCSANSHCRTGSRLAGSASLLLQTSSAVSRCGLFEALAEELDEKRLPPAQMRPAAMTVAPIPAG